MIEFELDSNGLELELHYIALAIVNEYSFGNIHIFSNKPAYMHIIWKLYTHKKGVKLANMLTM